MGDIEKLYRLHYKDIFNLVLSRIQNVDVAQDITQDTFVRACENLHIVEQENEEKTKAWLTTVATNLTIDYWRKLDRTNISLPLKNDYLNNEDMSKSDDPLKTILSSELKEIIRNSIELLKDEHKLAIELFDLKQLTYKDSSKIMGISDIAFASLLKRARKALIQEIIKQSVPNITKEPLAERELKKLLYWFDILDFPINLEEEIALKSRNFFNGLNYRFEHYRQSQYSAKLNDFLISTVKLEKDHIVADIGCGSGNLTYKLTPYVKKVYAIDNSVEMLNLLEENNKRYNYENIEPVVAHVGSDFSFPSERIDVAFCCMVLHHVFDPETAIRKMAKSIVKGGHLIIADLAYTTENWKFKDSHDFWTGFKLKQMEKWLKNAGLAIVKIEENKQHSFKFYDKENDDDRIEVPLLYAHCKK